MKFRDSKSRKLSEAVQETNKAKTVEKISYPTSSGSLLKAEKTMKTMLGMVEKAKSHSKGRV